MMNMKRKNCNKGSRYVLIPLLLIFFILPLAASTLQGLHILGGDWGYEQGADAQKKAISDIMANAKDQNYNAVYFQVREAGESFYPNKDGSWSTLFNETDPGYDPLNFALKEAHKNGLQFYAQFDVLGAYSLVNRPASPDHLYSGDGKIWIVADDTFDPIEYNASYYLDPANPQVISYLKSQIRELIGKYDLNGIYFTNLCYPGEAVIKTDVFSRQHQAVEAFSQLDITAYAQSLVTSCLEALSTEVRLYKPYLAIFAEVEPLLKESKGIRDLEPADTYYFQHGLRWLEKGLADVLVPRLHVRNKSFNALFGLYINNSELFPYIIPSLRGDTEGYREQDVKKELDYILKNDVKGAIVFSADDALSGKAIFEEIADMPYMTRTHHAAKAIELDMSGMNVPENIVYTEYDRSFHYTDHDQKLSLISTDLPRYLELRTMQDKMRFQTREWVPPIRYKVVSANEVKSPDLFIELRKSPEFISADSSFAFLYRASVGDTRINGEPVEAYSNTHIFFKEIPFRPIGQATKVRGSVSVQNRTLFYEDLYFGNVPDTTTRRAVIIESVVPQDTVILPPDDVLNLSFSSMMADELDTILLYVNGNPLPLYYNGSKFVGEVPCRMIAPGKIAYLQVAARDIRGNDYSYDLPLTLMLREAHLFPVVESAVDFTQVSYSLGEVRLGGPYMQEYPQGVRFKTNGKFGNAYRLKLSESDVGYVPKNEVKVLAAGMPVPQFNLYNMTVKPDSNRDVLTIPWSEPVPYTVLAQPEQNRIRIRLYGVSSNSTWLTHYEGLRMIDHISWEQHDAQTYDIFVNLTSDNIWGYNLEQGKKFLQLWVKYPPLRKDIRVAVEAGHGGEWNWGAVGLSGMKEKDLNRDTSDRLREILIQMGYDVVDIRPEDTGPRLRERWLLTDSLDADIFVSIHANAASGGYLRVGGTSTYYHNPFWQDYAELGYKKLRELDLDEFGVVGSFNYMMCRMSQRPSMLVEQAFMSHAEDENKLADPDFRQKMAEKIAETINEYINDKLSR